LALAGQDALSQRRKTTWHAVGDGPGSVDLNVALDHVDRLVEMTAEIMLFAIWWAWILSAGHSLTPV
jgi:hypothetical protein